MDTKWAKVRAIKKGCCREPRPPTFAKYITHVRIPQLRYVLELLSITNGLILFYSFSLLSWIDLLFSLHFFFHRFQRHVLFSQSDSVLEAYNFYNIKKKGILFFFLFSFICFLFPHFPVSRYDPGIVSVSFLSC